MELGNYKKAPYERPECWEYCRIKAKKKKKAKKVIEESIQNIKKQPEILGYTPEEQFKSLCRIAFVLIFLLAMCERTI